MRSPFGGMSTGSAAWLLAAALVRNGSLGFAFVPATMVGASGYTERTEAARDWRPGFRDFSFGIQPLSGAARTQMP